MSELQGPGWQLKKPPPGGDPEPAPKPRRYWWRFLLASVLIVGASAGAVAASGILFANSIVEQFRPDPALANIQKQLADVHGGEPENILILGSDKRAGPQFAGDPGRSDTTILLRLDPSKKLISVMSIPRDLKVEIPGYGIAKFNAAYSYGGPKLTLKVVKELTGLKINHVVNIDFLGFVRAVDAIGCVYTDVDRRYYHSNLGVPPSEQYSEIDIQPGYQLLCGKKALQYVRYRHTDTDIVRSARQQSFLSQARQDVPLSDLLTGQSELIDIFTEYTSSDIHDGATLIRILDLLIESRNSTVNQVHFPATLGPSYVYSNEGEIHAAVREFMGETGAGSHGFPERTSGSQKGKGKKKSKGSTKGGKRVKPAVKPRPPGSDGLVPAREAGEAEAKLVARKAGHGFPVFYPTRLPSGAAYVESNPYEHIEDPRVYHLKDEDGKRHGAYRMVAEYQPEYELNYFGVQGIQGWSDPPILHDPSETKTINGREYEIFLDGDKVKLIAWHRGDNTYWVSNSLQQSLTNEQMVGIARSAHVILPNSKPSRAGRNG